MFVAADTMKRARKTAEIGTSTLIEGTRPVVVKGDG